MSQSQEGDGLGKKYSTQMRSWPVGSVLKLTLLDLELKGLPSEMEKPKREVAQSNQVQGQLYFQKQARK